MVVVVNSSKQTFKVYGKEQEGITSIIQSLKGMAGMCRTQWTSRANLENT